MIYIIEDNEIMADCIAHACKPKEAKIFRDALAAMDAIAEELPSLVFLDILLTGPDGFTFLNELASYSDTMKIPVVIVSSLNLKNRNLKSYGVVGILDKATMIPKDIKAYVERYTN